MEAIIRLDQEQRQIAAAISYAQHEVEKPQLTLMRSLKFTTEPFASSTLLPLLVRTIPVPMAYRSNLPAGGRGNPLLGLV